MNYEPEIGTAACPTCGATAGELPRAPIADRVDVVTDLPCDDDARARVGRVLGLVLEALDGPRAVAQLDAVMDPAALRYLRAATEAHRAGGVSQLRSLRPT